VFGVRILFHGLDFQPSEGPAKFSAGAPMHYRLELPANALRQFGGHDAAIARSLWSDPRTGRLVGETFDGERVDDAELLVLQAFVPADDIRVARAAGQKVVCDVTDTPEVPSTYLYYELVESMRPAAVAMYLAGDAITVSSAYLQHYFRSLPACPPVFLLRNALSVEEWGPADAPSEVQTLGWCGTLLERADDCSVLRPWLGGFLDRHDLRFIHVGEGAMGVPGFVRTPPTFAEAAGLDPARVEARPVRRFADYVATRPWSGIDLQLIPLMDHHFSRGKSCLKGLESAAQGIPFVASPHEEYRWFGCGRLVGTDLADQSPGAWIEALEAALDPAYRQQMALLARQRVEREDITVRWQEWEAAYREILRQHR
jgi:hypothetical protein